MRLLNVRRIFMQECKYAYPVEIHNRVLAFGTTQRLYANDYVKDHIFEQWRKI